MECPRCKRDLQDRADCPDCGWTWQFTEDDRDSPLPGADAPSLEHKIVEVPGSAPGVDVYAQEVTGSSDSELTPEPNRNTAKVDVKRSTVRDIHVHVGHSNEPKESHSLYNDTYELLPHCSDPIEIIRNDLDPYLREMKNGRRLLLIACANADLAFDAAKALVDRVGINDQKRKRGFDIEEGFQPDESSTLEHLLPDNGDRDQRKPVAVVVYSLSRPGEAFVRYLLRNKISRERLEMKSVSLLFIVKPTFLEGLTSEGALPKASGCRISYLRYLLRSHAGALKAGGVDWDVLERRIRAQSEKGLWDREEARLCGEVKQHLDQGTLVSEVEDREKRPRRPPIRPEVAFKDDQQIQKTVLFVATYFTSVTPAEFCSVTPAEFCELVAALLPDRDISADVRSVDASASERGLFGPRPAIELWREYQDSFISEHLRETPAESDITLVVDFVGTDDRALMRRYLDSFRQNYVKDQFTTLLHKGFLFHRSQRVTGKMIALAARYSDQYQDEFGREWLVDLIKGLHDRVNSDARAPESSGVFCLLDRVPFNRRGWGYSRVAELLRELMRSSQTADMVNRCLSDLMRLGRHEAVLNVIKRLRFASEREFDVLYWLKQLLERGTESIRQQAFNYLNGTVLQSDGKIQKTLDRLTAWLPDPDPQRQGYPKSGSFALLVLIGAAFQAVDRFNEQEAMAPNESSFLDISAEKSQRTKEIERLVKWLRHPAISAAILEAESFKWITFSENSPGEKKRLRLIGALLADWAVLLPKDNEPRADEVENNSHSRSDQVLPAIIKELVKDMNFDETREIISFLEQSNREVLRLLTKRDPKEQAHAQVEKERDRLSANWRAVARMIQSIRNAIQQLAFANN